MNPEELAFLAEQKRRSDESAARGSLYGPMWLVSCPRCDRPVWRAEISGNDEHIWCVYCLGDGFPPSRPATFGLIEATEKEE